MCVLSFYILPINDSRVDNAKIKNNHKALKEMFMVILELGEQLIHLVGRHPLVAKTGMTDESVNGRQQLLLHLYVYVVYDCCKALLVYDSYLLLHQSLQDNLII